MQKTMNVNLAGNPVFAEGNPCFLTAFNRNQENEMITKKVKSLPTIDITPSWEWCVEIYLISLEHGTPEGKEIAGNGLRKMGKILDQLKAERESK